MGKRVNYYIAPSLEQEADTTKYVGVILYSNNCHHDYCPETVFKALAKDSIGATDLTRKLLAETYPSTIGNNIEGDCPFSIQGDIDPDTPAIAVHFDGIEPAIAELPDGIHPHIGLINLAFNGVEFAREA